MINLPLFLKIEEKSFDNFLSILEKKIVDIRSKRIIFFTSKGIYEIFKIQINKILNESYNISILYIDDSTYDIAVKFAKKIAIENYEIVIGFGGGKVLDTAKYASYVSKKMFISIPTILSNDGVASPIAVLKTTNGKSKSFGCKSPDGIIIDTYIIRNQPIKFLMAGVGDTISNYTALYDWKLESKYNNIQINDFAYLLSNTALNMLMHSREDDIRSTNFIVQLAQSLVLSGLAMDTAGNSRPCSGSEHLFSHSIDENYNIEEIHGFKVALGSIASCILQDRSYKSIVALLNRYNVNISPKNMGITKEIFVGAWLKAKKTRLDRFSILNIIDLSEEKLEKVYNEIIEVFK